MPFTDIYRKQVELLVQTLPQVAEETCFALKGGTAINLFVRDMPRLSVDIDLTYLPIADRDHSLAEIDAALERGLTKSGRTLADFDMPALILTVTGRNDAEMAVAENAARRLLALYGSMPAYYPVLEMHGRDDLGPRLNAMSTEGRWDEMTELFTEDLMSEFCVMGRPEEIPDLIEQRCDGMVDRLSLYTPYPSNMEMWRDIVQEIKRRPGKVV